jgi:hypothetical protein
MTTAHEPPDPTAPLARRSVAGPMTLLVVGILILLVCVAPLLGGIAAAVVNARQGDDGYIRSPVAELSSEGYALTTPAANDRADRMDRIGRGGPPGDVISLQARVRTENDGSVFIGVASERDASEYLRGVQHSQLEDLRFSPYSVEYRDIPGHRVPGDPEEQTFWFDSASGTGFQDVEIPARDGDWVIVVMNGDATPNLDVEAQAGIRSSLLMPLAVTLLTIGGLLLLGGVTMIVFGAIGLGRARPAPAG